MNEQEWLGDNQLSLDIWSKKYRNGNESFEEWLNRVSGGDTEIRDLIIQKKFLFGGRILAGRYIKGVTLSNCFVCTPPEDNLESIFNTAYEMARTYSKGGGCGTDISNLRPEGAVVHNAAKSTTGPVSFMELYSFVTGLIAQNGRRGALMLTIDCRHPDIEKFINLKTKAGVCEKANISIKVSDDFMRAAMDDKDWVTEFTSEETGTITKTYKARDLLMLLAQRNWEWAEPGLLYWDTIKSYNMNNNNPEYQLVGTNPCGEIPLQSGGACLLGSINLSEFVLNPFTSDASIDFQGLQYTVEKVVIALNDVLDENIPTLPLEIQKKTASDWRAIGLGTMGMADMLIKLGIKYGSIDALEVLDKVYSTIAHKAVETSLDLAKKYGAFPKCNPSLVADSHFIRGIGLSEKTKTEIAEYGLRNAQLLTCAPTGSIATMLQVSTGIEPNFALHYTRKTQSLNSKDTYYTVDAKIIEDYKKDKTFTTNDKFPDYFVESKDIKIIDRIKTQGLIQCYIDNSISSTINLPKEATVEDVYNIYVDAWRYGLKGVTVYRSGCKREGILTTKKPDEILMTGAPKRPEKLLCDIHKVRVKKENFIVCVGLYENKPYEIFVFRLKHDITLTEKKGVIIKLTKGVYKLISKDLEVANLLNTDISVEEKAATLYSSMLLRHGINIKYIIKTAKKVDDNITSFSSAMCRILAKYMPVTTEGKCPECGEPLVHSGGCVSCLSCGFSKCE